MSEKVSWEGTVTSVQPRIRLFRSYDERSYSYLGYVLLINGNIEDEAREFSITVGKKTHEKHQICIGDKISGKAAPVVDKTMEIAEYYKVSKLKILSQDDRKEQEGPPWQGIASALEIYQERGYRRLSPCTYREKCMPCIWGCLKPVKIIIDLWSQHLDYRYETFCYGPKSCSFYQAGATRKVPGRGGKVWEEKDWVDEATTRHRRKNE